MTPNLRRVLNFCRYRSDVRYLSRRCFWSQSRCGKLAVAEPRQHWRSELVEIIKQRLVGGFENDDQLTSVGNEIAKLAHIGQRYDPSRLPW